MRSNDDVRHITSIQILVICRGQFGAAVKYAKHTPHPGGVTYTRLPTINKGLNHVRRKLDFTYWTLSAYLKHRVKNAVEMEGVLYCNDGDWVESGAVPVRPPRGEFQIAGWAASRRSLPAKAAA